MILKKTLSHDFVRFNSFHVSTQTAIIQNHFSKIQEFDHTTVTYFIKILEFLMFLEQTLSHIFFKKKWFLYLTLCKNIQIHLTESGFATVNYFIKILKF